MKYLVAVAAGLIFLCGGVAVAHFSQPPGTRGVPQIYSFKLEKQYLTARGKKLDRVEVIAVPLNAASVREYLLLGEAVKRNETGEGQVWVFPNPKEEVLAEEIFARGIDKAGFEVGRVSLPYRGAPAISQYLWGASIL